MKIILISVLAGAAVAALVVAIPAVLAAVVILTETSKERGKSHEKQL